MTVSFQGCSTTSCLGEIPMNITGGFLEQKPMNFTHKKPKASEISRNFWLATSWGMSWFLSGWYCLKMAMIFWVKQVVFAQAKLRSFTFHSPDFVDPSKTAGFLVKPYDSRWVLIRPEVVRWISSINIWDGGNSNLRYVPQSCPVSCVIKVEAERHEIPSLLNTRVHISWVL